MSHFRNVLLMLFAWGMAFPACSEEPTPDKHLDASTKLYDQLVKGPDREKALERVLKTSEVQPPLVLFPAAGVAYSLDRLEDSAFLFYAGQLRFRFDQHAFPAKETGGNSPYLAIAAMSQQLGMGINPEIMSQPKTFLAAIERVAKWQPKAPDSYSPGYECSERLSQEQATAKAKPQRDEFVAGMTKLAKLLSDPEFFAARETVRKYNLTFDDSRPTEQEKEKAIETMKRIEREKNLPGPNVTEKMFSGR